MDMSDVRFPNVSVQLVGQDGNAFAILGRVIKALRKAEVSQEEIDVFLEEAQSGDYNNLLRVVCEWVDAE